MNRSPATAAFGFTHYKHLVKSDAPIGIEENSAGKRRFGDLSPKSLEIWKWFTRSNRRMRRREGVVSLGTMYKSF